jgi:hypothetical protein
MLLCLSSIKMEVIGCNYMSQYLARFQSKLSVLLYIEHKSSNSRLETYYAVMFVINEDKINVQLDP